MLGCWHLAVSFEDMYKRVQEYMSLQHHNSKLQKYGETHSESLKRVEMEKLTIIDNLSNLRCYNKALQDQLASFQYIFTTAIVFVCLDRQVTQVQPFMFSQALHRASSACL